MKKGAATPNSEKNPPSLPRRKRSTVSDRTSSDHTTFHSAHSSVQDSTWRTVELTPFSASTMIPVDSRRRASSTTSFDSAGGLSHPPHDRNFFSKLENNGSMEGGTRANLLTEAKIRAFFNDWFEDFDSICGKGFEACSLFLERYYGSDYKFVRPSGNPLDRIGLARMLSIDATVTSVKLVSIDSIYTMENRRAAVVMYTTDQIFIYKGITNEDRAIVSCVLESNVGEIKVVHEHRTSGIPIPKETRWSSIE